MSPTISVLMPVYNAERYVAGAVESVLGQSFRDFEFLIVDDGSTDGSLPILTRYAEQDDRVRLVSRPNTGIVGALNDGLAAARGEFVARMDADDVALPERFALQLGFLRGHPEVLCVGGAYQIIDGAGRLLTRLTPPLDDATMQDLALSGHAPLAHPTAMMRREAVLAAGGYREEMKWAEDVDLWLRLGEMGRLANLPEVVLKYREHGTSVSQLRHAVQRERAKAAADQACDRRGVRRRDEPPSPSRPGGDRSSEHAFSLRNGWWAFGSGERGTALLYAARAVRWMPWRVDGWKLLACALFKSVGRTA